MKLASEMNKSQEGMRLMRRFSSWVSWRALNITGRDWLLKAELGYTWSCWEFKKVWKKRSFLIARIFWLCEPLDKFQKWDKMEDLLKRSQKPKVTGYSISQIVWIIKRGKVKVNCYNKRLLPKWVIRGFRSWELTSALLAWFNVYDLTILVTSLESEQPSAAS